MHILIDERDGPVCVMSPLTIDRRLELVEASIIGRTQINPKLPSHKRNNIFLLLTL